MGTLQVAAAHAVAVNEGNDDKLAEESPSRIDAFTSLVQVLQRCRELQLDSNGTCSLSVAEYKPARQ